MRKGVLRCEMGQAQTKFDGALTFECRHFAPGMDRRKCRNLCKKLCKCCNDRRSAATQLLSARRRLEACFLGHFRPLNLRSIRTGAPPAPSVRPRRAGAWARRYHHRPKDQPRTAHLRRATSVCPASVSFRVFGIRYPRPSRHACPSRPSSAAPAWPLLVLSGTTFVEPENERQHERQHHD